MYSEYDMIVQVRTVVVKNGKEGEGQKKKRIPPSSPPIALALAL